MRLFSVVVIAGFVATANADSSVPGAAQRPSGMADRDGDGIPDSRDQCPDQPEDKDGFQDEDGCPDPDNDGDGIPDVDDLCPNEPETFNGFEDEDGCPDRGRTVVTKSQIEVLDKISFATNRATVTPSSLPMLDVVAKTLKGNPALRKVEVGIHSDERGDDAYNLRLSQERAEAVVRLLVERGIGAERLVARGYGETKPLCGAHNEQCWSRNRRTEFTILERR